MSRIINTTEILSWRKTLRLQKYLTEKFIDGVKISGHVFEIFKNPTRKELKDLDDGNGFRFLIDTKNKNIYFTNSEIFHRDMLKSSEVSRETGFTYSRWGKYWDGHDEAITYIFMGDCESNMGFVNSDVLGSMVSDSITNALPKLDMLSLKDFSWVRKYGINPKDIESEIANTIELLTDKL